MEKIEVSLGIKGRGKRAILPPFFKVLRVVNGKKRRTSKKTTEVSLTKDGYAILSYNGKLLFLIKTCVYYQIVSKAFFYKYFKNPNEKARRSALCAVCLSSQALRKLSFSLNGSGTIEDAALSHLTGAVEKLKCPYFYSVKPKRALKLFRSVFHPGNIRRILKKEDARIIFYEKSHPFFVSIKHTVGSVKKNNVLQKKEEKSFNFS